MPRRQEKSIQQASWAMDFDDFIREVPLDETFQLGALTDKTAVVTLECKGCGSREFNVGQSSDDLFTVIRCPKCNWELGIHDG